MKKIFFLLTMFIALNVGAKPKQKPSFLRQIQHALDDRAKLEAVNTDPKCTKCKKEPPRGPLEGIPGFEKVVDKLSPSSKKEWDILLKEYDDAKQPEKELPKVKERLIEQATSIRSWDCVVIGTNPDKEVTVHYHTKWSMHEGYVESMKSLRLHAGDLHIFPWTVREYKGAQIASWEFFGSQFLLHCKPSTGT